MSYDVTLSGTIQLGIVKIHHYEMDPLYEIRALWCSKSFRMWQ